MARENDNFVKETVIKVSETIDVPLWPVLINLFIILVYGIHLAMCFIFYGKNFLNYKKTRLRTKNLTFFEGL